jgi:hypothetical protein
MVAAPADTPVSTPVVLIEAIAALLVLHTPPEAVSDNALVAPTHIEVVPLIVPADAAELTVTAWVALAVPQLLVTE